MNRQQFIDTVEKNNIPFKKIIGINNSFDIETESNVKIDRSIFPEHKGESWNFSDIGINKNIYSFNFNKKGEKIK